MKKRLIILCFLLFFTGCKEKSNYSMVEEINRLTEENIKINEKLIELENIISSSSNENAEVDQNDLNNEQVKNFTLDMNFYNEYQSKSKKYKIVTNAAGTYLVNQNYEPLDRITSEANPTQNCWSKNDNNVMFEIGYEWYSDYYVYNIETNRLNKLFENDDYNVVGKYSYENKRFGFLSHFVTWLDDEKLIFIEGNGSPKDGSDPEYRERGYRSDVFIYDWKNHELMRLTDAEDGEYYDYVGVNATDTALIFNLVKYNKESVITEKTIIEIFIKSY